MEFKIINDDKGGRFTALDGEVEKGFIGFKMQGESIIDAYTTQVPKEFGGEGIGTSLVVELVEYARENGMKIVPTCPFILNYFKKNADDVADVWFDGPQE